MGGAEVSACPCPIKECNGGACPCGKCHGAGWYYEADPSGATESYGYPGLENEPVLLEKYCDCPKGRRKMEAGT